MSRYALHPKYLPAHHASTLELFKEMSDEGQI